MAWLHRSGFRTISFSQLFQGGLIPEQKYVLITFDDAYRSVLRHAFPVLQKYGFSATIFPITDFVGKKNFWDINLGWRTFEHLDWSDIRQLAAAGWEIGSHTATHPDLTASSPQKISRELTDSRKKLEDQTGKPVKMLAYPFGRYNQEVIQHAAAAGYRGGCTMRFGFTSGLAQPFLFPRLGIYFWDPILAFKAKIFPTVLTPFESSLQYLISFCARGTIIANRMKPKKSLQFL
jgi:peptidoglycan/xylan/chitin deacetylase (PgdA/CDA1 family)